MTDLTPDRIKNMNKDELKELAIKTYSFIGNKEYPTIKMLILERAQKLDIVDDLNVTFDFQEKAFNDNGTSETKFNARQAADFGEDDTDFIWYPYIPRGDYTVLMAPGGTGKTIFCCAIAAAISKGERLFGTIPDDVPTSGNVLIISAEDRGELLKKRLKACNANLNNVYILDCMDSEGLNFTQDSEIFKNTIQQYSPQLVIIDPWHAFLGATVDINRVNAVRPVFQKLANIAKECNCGMLLISHINKRAQGENINNAATGSSDFVNAARSAIMLIFSDEPVEENIRIAVHTKTNYAGAGQSIKFRITSQSGLEWVGFSDITRQTLENAARWKKTPTEVIHQHSDDLYVNQALIDAIKEKAVLGQHVNISYDQFKEEYGEDIFETSRPKNEFARIADKLKPFKITITAGKSVKYQSKSRNGFEIYRSL